MNLYDIGLFLEKNLFIVLVITLLGLLMLLRQYNLFMGRTYKEKIRAYYSEDQLISLLGRDTVVFPVVGRNDKIPLRSLHTYKKNYLYGSILATPMGAGFQQGSIIDKSGKKYKLVKKKLQEFGIVPDEVSKLVFEGVELIQGEVVDFKKMKEELLDEITKEGIQHPYYDIQEKIVGATTLEELTELMDSVPH